MRKVTLLNELIAALSCWATFSKTSPAVNRRSHNFLFFARTLYTHIYSENIADYDATLLQTQFAADQNVCSVKSTAEFIKRFSCGTD